MCPAATGLPGIRLPRGQHEPLIGFEARDRIEGQFETLLQSLKPQPDLFELAQRMMREIWDGRMNSGNA
jgi:hypothetical protein